MLKTNVSGYIYVHCIQERADTTRQANALFLHGATLTPQPVPRRPGCHVGVRQPQSTLSFRQPQAGRGHRTPMDHERLACSSTAAQYLSSHICVTTFHTLCPPWTETLPLSVTQGRPHRLYTMAQRNRSPQFTY